MLRGAFAPSSVNAEARTVELVWTTGAEVRRYDWRNGGYYWERLKVDEKSIDLSRLRSGAPLLALHNQYSLNGQIGVVESVRVEGGRGYATVRFSRRDDVEPIWQDVRDGIIRNVSVGYEQNKLRDTSEERDGIPVREVTRWTPHELSLVSIPADAGAQVRASHPTEDPEDTTDMAHPNADTTARTAATTPAPATPATPASTTPDDAAIRAAASSAAQEAVRAERERVDAIHHAVDAARLSDGAAFARALVSEGVSADVARERVLARLAEQSPPPTQGHVVQPGDGRRDAQHRALIVDALAHRCGGPAPADPESLRIGARGIMRIAEDLLESGGRSTRHMAPAQLARAAMATGDFTEIIADVAARSLTRGYDAEMRTFAGVFRQTTAANFRPIERIKLSDVPALAAIAEGGPYTEVAFTEDKETYAVGKFGRKIGYTWEMMVNEDLDALSRIPSMLGAAAARLENDTVWGVLTTNGNLADGDPLFDVGVNESSVVLDAAGLAAARLYLRTAVTENGQPLNLQAEYLVVGPQLENTAELLLAVLPEMATTSRANIVAPGLRTRLKLVVEPRITANNWYVLTAPTSIDTMEYAYLQGYESPTLTRDEPFSVDQVDMKIRHVIGAGAIDRRGMWHSDSTP